MKKMLFKSLLSLLVCSSFSVALAQKAYMLKQVNTVTADGLYVFEQRGWVMSNTVSGNALQTIQNYNEHGLTGTESYVWKLENASGGYYLRNMSLGSKCYLTYSGSSTAVTLSAKNDYSIWTVDFQSDETVLIKNKKASSRYLGFVDKGTNYKAYSTDDMTYEHSIRVFQLVEDTGEEPTPEVSLPSFSMPEGDVESGTVVTLTSGALTLRYTTDGSDPTTSSTSVKTSGNTADITIEETTTIKAVSVDADGNMSEVLVATYNVQSNRMIDLRNRTNDLVFEDFGSFPVSYSSTAMAVNAPASDGKTYEWMAKNVQVDSDGSLRLKAGEGQIKSWPVWSDYGFIVRVTFDVSSTVTVSLSLTGGATVTNTYHYSEGRTRTIETSTQITEDAVITFSSINNTPSLSRIVLLPTDEFGVPTGMDVTLEYVDVGVREGSCYDIIGQRVSCPIRGLYVVDGKKVWFR